MKKVFSLFLACVLIFSGFSVLAFADNTQYYRDDIYEFYLDSDKGAHIVNILKSDTTELKIPLMVYCEAQNKIDGITASSIADDDNEAEDPFSHETAYVTSIEAGALDNYADTLTSIHLSRYIEEVDLESLKVPTLQEITVNENNKTFSAANGTLYNANKTKLILHPQASSDNTVLSTVTSFEEGAFADSVNITSITIPAKVTSISAHCFDGCTSLQSVDMTAAKISKIGTYAFLNTAISTVNLGTYIKRIDNFAFFGCKNLKNVVIPEAAKNVSIGDGAFIGCPIENLTIYRSVVEMGDKAIGFYYDADFALQQYDNLVITSYKYDEAMTNKTEVYKYVKKNNIKFIPLDDIYCLTFTDNQFVGRESTMYLYVGNKLMHTVNSNTGVFEVKNVARANYSVFFVTKFGLIIKDATLSIKTEDYQEEYNRTVVKYDPIGNVNGDTKIDIQDVAEILKEENYSGTNTAYDIDEDGVVGLSDISIILAKNNYGKNSDTLPDKNTTPIIPIG